MPCKDFKTAQLKNYQGLLGHHLDMGGKGLMTNAMAVREVPKQVYDDTPALQLLWLPVTLFTVGSFVEGWKSILFIFECLVL